MGLARINHNFLAFKRYKKSDDAKGIQREGVLF
jgi:hypothetical protein